MSEVGKILINAGPSLVGWHYHESWLRCQMMWAHEQILKTPRRTGPALAKGALFHVGAAQVLSRWQAARGGVNFYDGKSQDPERITDPERFHAPGAAIGTVAMLEGADWLKEAPGMLDVTAAFEREVNLSSTLADAMQVVAVEFQMKAEVGGYVYTQRADLVLEDSAGKVWIVDHKTTGNVSGTTETAFTMHGQFLGYQWFGQAYWGARFGGVLIHYAEIKKDATKFIPVKPIFSPWMLKRFPENLVLARRGAEAARAEISAGTRDPWHLQAGMSEMICVHRYGLCTYFSACHAGPPEKR